jgi:hypothetical protein
VSYCQLSDRFIIDIGEGTITYAKPSTLEFNDKEIAKLAKNGLWDELLRFYRFENNRLIKYKYYA